MEVIFRNVRSSDLNPNAPIYVPSAYREVEDFSDQWWDLVQSTPWFRDYWLQECFSDPQNDPAFPDDDDPFLPDADSLLSGDPFDTREEQIRGSRRDLITLGSLNWGKTRVAAEIPRFAEKAPKIVNVKASPRPIQQPR